MPSQRRALGLLFLVLTLGFGLIALAAGRGGRLGIGRGAALGLATCRSAGWMATIVAIADAAASVRLSKSRARRGGVFSPRGEGGGHQRALAAVPQDAATGRSATG